MADRSYFNLVGGGVINRDIISWSSFEFRDIAAGISTEYTIDTKATIPYFINSVTLEVNNGSLTDVSVEVNGTPINGLSGITATTFLNEIQPTSLVNVYSGDAVTISVGEGHTGDPNILKGKLNIEYNN